MVVRTLKYLTVGAAAVLVVSGTALAADNVPAVAEPTMAQPVTEAVAPGPPPLPTLMSRQVGVSPPDASGPQRTARAQCPSGTKVVGGGGEGVVSPGFTRRLIPTRLVPDTTTNQYVVTVTDFNPFNAQDEWFVVAYATCAPTPIDYAVISVPTPFSSEPIQQVTAPCPGRQAIGTGAEIIAQADEKVGLQTTFSTVTGSDVTVRAQDTNGSVAQPWRLVGYAICMRAETFVQPSNVTGPARRNLVRTTCPTGFLLGTGARVNNTPHDIVINRIRPSSDLLTVEVRVMKVSSPTPSPPDATWTVTAQGICNWALTN